MSSTRSDLCSSSVLLSFLFLLAAIAVNLQGAQGIDETCFANPKLQAANYQRCQGNQLEIYSVNISTLYNTVKQRHALFKGDNVQICISGSTKGLKRPVPFIQNSVHGSISILGLGVNNPFCNIEWNACKQLTPACQQGQPALQPEQDFCFCSSLEVPTVSPEVEVQVTWKILGLEQTPSSCEDVFSADDLKAKGKEVLVCLSIPAMVRNADKKPPGF